MKSYFVLLGALCLTGLMASASYAGTTINGTSITFNDATVQTTAFTVGGGGAPADHGGTNNTVNGTDSFVGGGYSNLVTDDYGTIGGGYNNQAGDNAGTTADRKLATVGGGKNNRATGYLSTISGGFGNTASGSGSIVAGGLNNNVSGDYSFAAGKFVTVLHNNSFVWGDSGGGGSAAADTFNVWATGGIYLNGPVKHASDRNMKEAFSFVSAREVLDKVVQMPVTTWRFKSEDESVRHIGPVAQDFMAAFGYGIDDKYITATDADGVALAAIQGLNAKVEGQAETITALRWHNAQLHGHNAALEARLTRLENAILRESEREPTRSD